ncbi:hypothetical protein BH09ACT4_BH09ACT4_18090 [soil metagenome]
MGALAIATAGASLAVGLTSCVASGSPTPAPTDSVDIGDHIVADEFVAGSLEQARSERSGDTLVIYDLSSPILDLPASYNGGADESQWIVVVACGPAKHPAVGVVPRSGADSDVLGRARDGGYDSLLLECG